MKKILLTLLVFSVSIVLYSQNENPFAEFGYNVLVATSSNGEFTEFHDQTDIVEIGSVLYNRHTKEIVKVLDKDETAIDISSATTAMSIDPHCEKYYWISPYAYCLNNPIKFIDPDGRDVVVLNAPKGAGGRGHMGAIIQNSKGEWHYMTMGAAGGSTLEMLTSGVQGGMALVPLGTKDQAEALSLAKQDVNNAEYTETVSFKTSTDMDGKIYDNAVSMQESVNKGDTKYNALRNNCADAVVKTISSGTGVEISTTSDPRPNSVYKDIKNNQAKTQENINTKVADAKAASLKEVREEQRRENRGTSSNRP